MVTLHADPDHHKALGCHKHQEFGLNWFCEYLCYMVSIPHHFVVNNVNENKSIKQKIKQCYLIVLDL